MSEPQPLVEVLPPLWTYPAIGTVLMDPPWFERGGGKIKRGADRHYDLLKTKTMPEVVAGCPYWGNWQESVHLYMWVTNTYLCNGDALWLAKELGFRPITLLTWAKTRIGLGQYFRGQTEHVLFCVKGPTLFTEGTHSTLLGGDKIPHPVDEKGKRIHSRKPDQLHRLIEEASPGKHLEIFARVPQENWLTWGNELEDWITLEEE